MEYIAYLLLGLALIWLMYLMYLWVAGQAVAGKDIRHLKINLPQLAEHPELVLIYCFSPSCGPCRSMSPVIEQLQQQGHPIISVDVSQAEQVSRELEIRAVPTLLRVKHGVVDKVIIGGQSPAQLKKLLQADNP